MDKLSDEQLLREIEARKTKAINEIYNRYKRQVVGFLVKNGNDEHDATSWYGEAIMVVCNKAALLTVDISLKSFIMRVAINHCNKFYRDVKKKQPPLLSFEGKEVSDESINDTVTEEDERFVKVFSMLSKGCQEYLDMVYWQNLDGAEIAKIKGNTVGSVYVALTRCRDNMKEWYGKLFGI